jgi:hypothetical protein
LKKTFFENSTDFWCHRSLSHAGSFGSAIGSSLFVRALQSLPMVHQEEYFRAEFGVAFDKIELGEKHNVAGVFAAAEALLGRRQGANSPKNSSTSSASM